MVLLITRRYSGGMTPRYVATEVEDDGLEEYWREDDTAFVFEEKFDSIDGLADFLRKYFGETVG